MINNISKFFININYFYLIFFILFIFIVLEIFSLFNKISKMNNKKLKLYPANDKEFVGQEKFLKIDKVIYRAFIILVCFASILFSYYIYLNFLNNGFAFYMLFTTINFASFVPLLCIIEGESNLVITKYFRKNYIKKNNLKKLDIIFDNLFLIVFFFLALNFFTAFYVFLFIMTDFEQDVTKSFKKISKKYVGITKEDKFLLNIFITIISFFTIPASVLPWCFNFENFAGLNKVEVKALLIGLSFLVTYGDALYTLFFLGILNDYTKNFVIKLPPEFPKGFDIDIFNNNFLYYEGENRGSIIIELIEYSMHNAKKYKNNDFLVPIISFHFLNKENKEDMIEYKYHLTSNIKKEETIDKRLLEFKYNLKNITKFINEDEKYIVKVENNEDKIINNILIYTKECNKKIKEENQNEIKNENN